jgi:hypothetical protein
LAFRKEGQERAMVTNEVRPKTTPGQAPRGQLTYVAILALVVAVVLLAAAVVRPMLHNASAPSQSGPPPPTVPSPPGKAG